MTDFKRHIEQKLLDWKKSQRRKPLVLLGARQVGKTTVLKSLGERHYKETLYLNLDLDKDAHSIFSGNIDPQTILKGLALHTGQSIEAEETLIIFDEIQECPKALSSLKYFYEEASDYHIATAGSLLGVSYGPDKSFPVGKVNFLYMHPLTFDEYIQATDSKTYKQYVSIKGNKKIEPIQTSLHNNLTKHFQNYIAVGGMPEAVATYAETNALEDVREVHADILRAYELDFSKHTTAITSNKIRQLWTSLPSQLAKENRKFTYKAIKSGARAREYESGIQWLVDAGLVIKASSISKPHLPLSAYADVSAFKLYMLDTGLLFYLSQLSPEEYLLKNALFTEYKGAIMENYVAQSLRAMNHRELYYWTSASIAELDFVAEIDHSLIPIEVKSSKNTKAKSLQVYRKKYTPDISIKLSENNLSFQDGLLSIPLYLAGDIYTLLEKTE